MTERFKGHTPGPWIVCSPTHGTVDVMAERGPAVCRLYTDPAINYETPNLAEAGSNARLIAAAPDLLAAFEAMREALTTIRALVEAPYWTPDRKQKIERLCSSNLALADKVGR
jgi:hypothetical protein